MSRIREGLIPTADSLTAICRAENCSLSWLLAGKGPPYLVGRCDSDEECAERLDELLEENGWSVYLLTDGERHALALLQPGQFDVKGRPVDYTVLELLVGPFGRGAAMRLGDCITSGIPVSRAQLPAEHVARIYRGEVGTYELLQRDGGLIRFAAPVTNHRSALLTVQAVAETPANYAAGDEQKLLEAYRELDKPMRRAALAAVQAMGKE
ncbi:MAG: hypothetical protein AB1450_08250 [Pseudomonadota bacterium]